MASFKINGFKREVSIDIDGTLANTFRRVFDLHRMEGGQLLREKEFADYDMTKFMRHANGKSITSNDIRRLVRAAFAEKPTKIELIDERIPKLVAAMRADRIYVRMLSATWGDYQDVLRYLEEKNIRTDEVRFVQSDEEKSMAAGVIHVDDSPVASMAVARTGKTVLLIRHNYNVHVEAPNIVPILNCDWQAVYDHVSNPRLTLASR